MTHYINIDKKRLCGRNNNVVPPLIIDYSTIENVEFTFINSQNQIIPVEDGLSGFYMAGSVKMGEPSCELLFLSKDFQIVDGKLVFTVDTYTQPYLRQIKKKNTEINIEIGQISLESKKIWLRDYALANPRVYVAGLSPQEIESNDYYTKTETNELVDEQTAAALNDAKNYADGQDAATLASATAYTDEQIEHLEISGYVTDEELESAKAELEGDIALKAAESDLQLVSGEVDSLAQDITGKADKADVDIISGKVDEHIADIEIHTTALEKAAWDAKQNAITADNKLDYALLSGTPAIPTKTSDLTNDSGFATSGYVDDGLALKQDIIDESNPISGNAVLVTYDPWLGDPEFTAENAINMAHSEALQAQADATQANADIQIVSGALDEKQNKITSSNKLDYDLLSGEPDLSIYATEADLQTVSGVVDTKLEREFLHFYGTYKDGDSILKEISIGIKKTIDDPMLSANFEYSLDFGKSWHEYSFNGISGELITGHHIMFRGDNPNGFQPSYWKASSCHYQFYQSKSYEIHVRGNPYSLLSKEIREEQTGDRFNQNSYQFAYLFKDMTQLVDASNLFLPQFVHNSWFASMFENCTSLQHPPKFKKFFPRLENTRNDCAGLFASMFKNTNLAETPEIHIIQMYGYDDTNSFGNAQCNEMFSGCRNLNKVNLIIDIKNYNKVVKCLNSSFTKNWLYNVPASGTFCCSYGLDTSIRDASHIPAGWNVVYTSVPEEIVNQAAAVENLIMHND